MIFFQKMDAHDINFTLTVTDTVETHKSLHHKSLRNFKSLRFLVIFDDFPKKSPIRYRLYL